MSASADPETMLGTLSMLIADSVAARFRELGMSQTEAATLLCIHEHPGVNIGHVARTADISHSAAVRSVDRLVDRKLVDRWISPSDQRAVELTCSPMGKALSQKLFNARRETTRLLMDRLNPKQRTALTEFVDLMLEGVAERRSAAWRLCRFCDRSICPIPACPIGRCVQVEDTGAIR
ncbi:MarR family transcriptional regulator [Phyllobacterium salinisoli]|uniref:MarR family transcriptional regulator n=1 Tax=Phyllobacterium salinisoli TaxID=1899321 RepID=A0A368K8W5_9HYPH|nr:MULTISPECIES: MarR family transcriptional regulator [Hyphomicrobiales]RCS25797.1 MarR family transcriptional regulator [Phyllobacterium salinisoli]RVG68737.1 MarR family transcriptional regulator [Sinorhizobium meliloti]